MPTLDTVKYVFIVGGKNLYGFKCVACVHGWLVLCIISKLHLRYYCESLVFRHHVVVVLSSGSAGSSSFHKCSQRAAQYTSVSMCSLFTAALSLCDHVCVFMLVNESMYPCIWCLCQKERYNFPTLRISGGESPCSNSAAVFWKSKHKNKNISIVVNTNT